MCAYDVLNGNSFVYYFDGKYDKNNFVTYSSGSQSEFINGEMTIKQHVKWVSCDSFVLTIDTIIDYSIDYRALGFDTIKNRVIGISADTIKLMSIAKDFQHEIVLINLRKVKQ